MQQQIIYPGTFDPITKGHEDLIRRASKMFEKVTVAIANNPQKTPMLDLTTRIELIETVLCDLNNVTVTTFEGLLSDFAKSQSIQLVLRGVRTAADFDYERQLASMNHQLNAELETLFLPSAEKYAFISSSIVRDIVQLGGDITAFVDPVVKKALENRSEYEKFR